MVPEENSLPRPKSPIFRDSSMDMKIFAGFKSRCMIRFSCMWFSAEAIYCMYSQTRISSNGTSSACYIFISRFRSPFSAHSVTIMSSLLWINESIYLIIFGWSNGFIKPTSFKHLSRCFGSIMSNILMNFKEKDMHTLLGSFFICFKDGFSMWLEQQQRWRIVDVNFFFCLICWPFWINLLWFHWLPWFF